MYLIEFIKIVNKITNLNTTCWNLNNPEKLIAYQQIIFIIYFLILFYLSISILLFIRNKTEAFVKRNTIAWPENCFSNNFMFLIENVSNLLLCFYLNFLICIIVCIKIIQIQNVFKYFSKKIDLNYFIIFILGK